MMPGLRAVSFLQELRTTLQPSAAMVQLGRSATSVLWLCRDLGHDKCPCTRAPTPRAGVAAFNRRCGSGASGPCVRAYFRSKLAKWHSLGPDHAA
jgi:hypothetical protein